MNLNEKRTAIYPAAYITRERKGFDQENLTTFVLLVQKLNIIFPTEFTFSLQPIKIDKKKFSS